MKLFFSVFIFLFFSLSAMAVQPYRSDVVVGVCQKSLQEQARSSSSGILDMVHIEKIYSADEENPDLLLRDEEDDVCIIKSHIRNYCAFFSDIFFPVSFDLREDCIPVSRRFSCTEPCKYIVQRVLRI